MSTTPGPGTGPAQQPARHDDELAHRYGRPARWPWVVGLLVTLVLVGVAGSMVAWTALRSSDPAVQSAVLAFDVVDEHQVDASVRIEMSDDAEDVQCTLRAYAEDKSTVGETTFSPSGSGRFEVDIRTERRATSVEGLGCTAAGQERAR
ncbi:DUF4307 domain-containing protein [Nocardioides bruguierae]|uniref:DUF4307 domain-containing protein n=1 Tax=Nocardioides bruguierae TaxID=2945102 RepID=A0A9X2DAG3_9ACTN|nr:DUF4307 domain-containing protein [Nocardioides bruguierae]MCM0622331.1 DUF4307 domain-containing protein [Nocardioides bruguierae]